MSEATAPVGAEQLRAGAPPDPSTRVRSRGRRTRLLVALVRPPASAVLLLFAALGMVQVDGTGSLRWEMPVVALVIASWFLNATAMNDLADVEIDKVNLEGARGRPLVSGLATPRTLRWFAAGAATASLLAAWSLDWRAAVVVAACLALSAAYSLPPLRISARGGLATILLPLGYVSLPYLVGVFAVGDPSRDALVLMAGMYVVFAGRILLKDFRDVRGDDLYDKRTFLLRHGTPATCRVAAACWVAGCALLPLLVPMRSAVLPVCAVYLALALHGLWRLTQHDEFFHQQRFIAGIAGMGRMLTLTLLAHFTMAGRDFSLLRSTAFLVALGVLGVGRYVETIRLSDESAYRPY